MGTNTYVALCGVEDDVGRIVQRGEQIKAQLRY